MLTAGLIMLAVGFFLGLLGVFVYSESCSNSEDEVGVVFMVLGGFIFVIGIILTVAGACAPNRCHEPAPCAPQHIERAEVRQPAPQIFTTPNGVKVEVSGCDNCTVKVTTSP
jgi:hypothetical protein